MVEIDDDARDRGVLTTADRQYLRGEKNDITADTEVNTRVRIRKRIKHTLADFELLTHNLSPRDRKLLFKESGQSKRDEALADGVVAQNSDRGAGMLENTVIFVYMVCRDWGLDFESLIERAVKQAETSVWFDGQFQRREGIHDVDVTIDLHRDSDIDVESAKKRFDQGEYLSLPEIGALVRAGLIDEDELRQFQDEDWELGVTDGVSE
jgi:hypothetical protein